MNIVDWFEIRNPDHIKAYEHLMKNGTWPEHFIPADIEMNDGWQITLAFNLANAYVDAFLYGNLE